MMTKELRSKKWLVRAGGEILGPYDFEELKRELGEKKFTLLDEVRCPSSRWGFIREHQDLKEIVNWVRELQMHEKENTTGNVRTKTVTATDVEITALLNSDVTPTPVFRLEKEAEEPESNEVESEFEVEDLPSAVLREKTPLPEVSPMKKKSRNITYNEPEVEVFEDAYNSAPSQVKRYGASLERKPKKKSSPLLWTAVLLATSIISVALVWRFLPRAGERPLNYSENIKLAKFNQSLQYYERALEYYERAEKQQELDPSIQLHMLPLYVEVENKTAYVRDRLLELQNRPGMENNLDVQFYIGMTYLRENNFTPANDLFAEIMAKDPQRVDAPLNFLVSLYLEKSFGKLLETSELWIQQSMKDPLYILLRAMTVLQMFEKGTNPELFSRHIQELSRFINLDRVYRSEALLVLAALNSKLEQPIAMVDVILQLISESPRASLDMIHDLKIDPRPFHWDSLFQFCEDIRSENENSPAIFGLMTFCSYKKGDMLTAVKLIGQGREAYPANETLLALEAFLYLEQNQLAQSKASLRLASKPNLLHYLVRGRMCAQEKDFTCAETNWKAAREIQASNPEAVHGLAWIARQRGELDIANDLVRQGVLVASRHRPLIELQEELGALLKEKEQ
jgi:tetratricopeptide (TPR) repeat protein